MVFTTANEKETLQAGEEFAKSLRPGDVVAMRGYLGAGKTAFTRGVAAGLGLDARVSSPTFTIVNEYLGKVPLFHFDLYRLGDSEELFEIGWEEYLERGGICMVEWSENADDAMPRNTIYVNIEKTDETGRVITVDMPEGR